MALLAGRPAFHLPGQSQTFPRLPKPSGVCQHKQLLSSASCAFPHTGSQGCEESACGLAAGLRGARYTEDMGDAEPLGPLPHIDLDNFEEKQHQDCPYVLTSPRSLAACANLGLRPVQLLHQPLEALSAEGVPVAQLPELYAARERKRRVRLRLCKEERRRLQLLEARGRARDVEHHHRGFQQNEANKGGRAKSEEMIYERKEPTPGRKQPSQMEFSGEIMRLEGLKPQSEADRKLRQLVAQIEREAHLVIPQRDKKIAELMLAKYQEEQELEKRQVKMAQAWEEVLRSEAYTRKEMDVVLRNPHHQPHDGCQQGLAKQILWQPKEVNQNETIELSYGDHRRLSNPEDQETRLLLHRAECPKRSQELGRREHETAGKVAREQNDHLLHQRISRALQAKIQRVACERQRLQNENEQAKLRHSSHKEQVDEHACAEGWLRRLNLEHKTQKTTEAYVHLLEERNQKLRERAAREEQQIQQAQIRAELQQQELHRHKWLLVQNSESKIHQARKAVMQSMKEKAFRTHEVNTLKEQVHHILKKRMAEEVENHRREVEHTIHMKDRKSDQILREKEAILEESRKVARASFQMREKVREWTKNRSFDQMAFEAQLSASVIKDVN